MVLVVLYSVFGGVVAMMMGWNKFKVETFALHEGFENGRALVFKRMKDGAEATVIEMGVQGGIGP